MHDRVGWTVHLIETSEDIADTYLSGTLLTVLGRVMALGAPRIRKEIVF